MVPIKLTTKLIWRGLSAGYTSLQGAPSRVDEALLTKVEARCQTQLGTMPPFAARSFALPVGLRAFYLAAQDQLAPLRPEEGFQFYACTWLPTDGLQLADEAGGDSTPWLEIGSFSANRWAFICCDTEDDLFGTLVEREDSTPWSLSVYEAEVWSDTEAFLKHLYRSS